MLVAAIIATLSCGIALAQNYTISWSKIAGGGGTSTGGTLTLSGTIGQHDAQPDPVMSSGVLSLTGGFWAGPIATCSKPGDMNHDGLVDGSDIQLFVDCVVASSGSCGCADMDGGGVSASDLMPFVNALLSN